MLHIFIFVSHAALGIIVSIASKRNFSGFGVPKRRRRKQSWNGGGQIQSRSEVFVLFLRCCFNVSN